MNGADSKPAEAVGKPESATPDTAQAAAHAAIAATTAVPADLSAL